MHAPRREGRGAEREDRAARVAQDSLLPPLLLAVHVPEQVAHVIRRHADVAEDLLPAGAGEVHPMRLEDQLDRQWGIELLLLEQLPASLLDVTAAQRLQRIEIGLAPAAIVWVPVSLSEGGA